MDYFTYQSAIQQAISHSPHRGKVSVSHKRKKYELRLKDARTLASVLWGYTTRTNYRIGDDGPVMGLTFTRSTELKANGMVDADGLFTERGVAAAERAFTFLTGFDLDECAREVERLRKLSDERAKALERLRREGWGPIHDAEGKLVGLSNKLSFSPADMAVIGDQIKTLRERS